MSVSSRYALQMAMFLSIGASFILSSSAYADNASLTNTQLMQIVQPAPSQPLPIQATQAPTQQNSAHADNLASVPVAQPLPSVEADPQLAELRINGSYDFSPSDSINGGSNYGINTTLYSAPIEEHWRIFAGEYYTHEIEPIGEGVIGYSQSMAGAEYHNSHLVIEAAPTYNHFNGSERVGATGDGTWTFNDMWAIGGSGQLFSRDIPLRALNAGITANSYDANATWTEDTRRDLRLDATAMNFSDDNLRTSVGGVYTEHLIDSSRYALDGLLNVIESQNTKDENRPYFNPDHDAQGMVGARVTQPLYTKTSLLYEHSLEVTPGVYYQESYGTQAAFNAKYSQRLYLGHTFEGGVSIDYSRQDYDGVAQNDETVLFDLTERF